MNKVNNNISVGNSNTALKKQIQATINSFENSNDNYDLSDKNNCIISPNYKKAKIKIKIKNNKNDNNKKIIGKKNLFSNLFKNKGNTKRAADSFSYNNNYYDSSFNNKLNPNNISNLKSISIKKVEKIHNSKEQKIKNIKLDIKKKTHNIKLINTIRNNTFIIEKLIDDFMEKK